MPSYNPTPQPTTDAPTSYPTTDPSLVPSLVPTSQPTILPSCTPTVNPTSMPSYNPSSQPTMPPKDMFFDDGPISVYSNITYYTTKYFPTTSYLFSFQLSALPLFNILITPQIVGAHSELIEVHPRVFLFNSTSYQKQAWFYINGPSDLQGNYDMRLNITGPSAAEYSLKHSVYSVRLLPSSGALLPPKLLTAVLRDSGNGFTLLFDSPTDQANIINTNWNCSLLFRFPSNLFNFMLVG